MPSTIERSIQFTEDACDYFEIPANILPVGDHIIFYPGENEAFFCTRSEAQRIGLEDLFLLSLLKKKDKPVAEKLIEMLFRDYQDYEKDVSKYREVKELLLKSLSC